MDTATATSRLRYIRADLASAKAVESQVPEPRLNPDRRVPDEKPGVLGCLRDEAWNGFRALVSLGTLFAMFGLAYLVNRWTAAQSQAYLSIDPLTWTVSEDLTQWRVQALVDNHGPRTATDLRLEATLAVNPSVQLVTLVILQRNDTLKLNGEPRASTGTWTTALGDSDLQREDIALLHYERYIDDLLVGEQLLISASFKTDSSFGEELLRTLDNRNHMPLTNPHGAGPDYFEYAHQQWVMLVLRGYFIHDVALSGNMVIAHKSSLWQPVSFR